MASGTASNRVVVDSARNRRIGLMALGGAAAMLGLGFASVPLYRIFCQVTGFGGTTQRVSEAEAKGVATASRRMTVRFDANVHRGLPWRFGPEQVKQDVAVGARNMAVFVARNDSDHPITGTAIFNVSPEQAGKYFNKIQCFCFTEQRLEAGQEVRMPVIYYVDPAILNDPAANNISEITLSYTFMEQAGSATGSGKTAAK